MYFLAIDIGASSGRHILGTLINGQLKLEEIYRFDNVQVYKNGHDCWDVDAIQKGILNGLKACRELGKIPTTIGIDTWGVDFLLLDEHDEVIGDAVAYRDKRTEGMRESVENHISTKDLYNRTGIQYQPYNTIYQLMALKEEHSEQLEQAKCLLMTPDYYNFFLTGKKKNEYTIASTTALVDVHAKCWDKELIRNLGLPEAIFHELSLPGTTVGELRPEVQEQVGFNSVVMLVPSHDTASAFLAVPAQNDSAVYLSSGTWSLLGVELDAPIVSEESYRSGFANEGGAWYRYRFLQNIMGLWMIQSIRRELNGEAYVRGKNSQKEVNRKWGYPDLIEEAKKAEYFKSIVDVNHERFLSPDSMISALREECLETKQQVPESVAEIMQCVYTSLAICYKNAIEHLQKVTGKLYTSINIVGGGCQDSYLNAKTAEITGLPVLAGPVEGSAIGNIIIQMIVAKLFEDLHDARVAVRKSFDVIEF